MRLKGNNPKATEANRKARYEIVVPGFIHFTAGFLTHSHITCECSPLGLTFRYP
jgi:hypothetical protein